MFSEKGFEFINRKFTESYLNTDEKMVEIV